MIQKGDDLSVNRALTYRRAGRTLRYPVYVAIEAAWTVIAMYALAKDLFIAPGKAPEIALGLLVVLSLAHSAKMMVVQPWQLLKAILLGVIVFAAARGLTAFSDALFEPIMPAIIVGTAYYFWLGEQWTKRVATSNEE
ncbi:hypothetical protein [Pelagibius marinus]|uniref:hypothetical protein n=1 Tax=Pelagibius marinus TaxID=2762760 RepID=UPI001872822E|nr:hypothetical protein [Pelagibius marinus]